MAKDVWQVCSRELQHGRAQRQAILERIQQRQVEPQAWNTDASPMASGVDKLLQEVAELTENALLESEILGHAARMLSWQICSPDSIVRFVCHSWPAFPDLIGAIKAIAAMPEP